MNPSQELRAAAGWIRATAERDPANADLNELAELAGHPGHPRVALLVADMLDGEAEGAETAIELDLDVEELFAQPLALARAINGGQP